MPDADDLLALPRSVVLALWLARVGAGSGPVQTAVDAIEGDDEPHDVDAPDELLPGPAGLADLVAAWASGARVTAALLPVPGDATGLPPEVADIALEAGECVLVASAGRHWAAVPDVVPFGSALEPGHLVTWRVRAVPPWEQRLPGLVGTLAEADVELREALRQATEALTTLDVARWRPDAAAAMASLRGTGPLPWDLPSGLPPRALSVLATALRLRAIVRLATADDGGAVNLWQADQRSAALRHVERSARRAVAAATAAAGAVG